ncbi:MAG: UvrD-helicase domain-containing protein [Planctomycetes bacterium]|jgi:ATP-dependent helicase/nuclease subunit A|nr:UvrD-helicase domain-containing protein [Planctomycetota bacterium]
MTDKQVKWTEQQRQAILARGGNVFVTASAGTGKTAVLSGRCVSLVADGAAGPDVLSMLVLTFTEAAAEQMHARIAQQLREAYHQTRNSHFLRQLVLLQGANISTIHSFCKRLIAEHFHQLSLDPAFRVIDADEAMLLKAETLDETIEWAWRQDHLVPGLHELLHRRDLRGSEGFLGSVIQLSDFLEGVVAPQRWCDRACVLAGQIDPLGSELGDKQQQIVRDRLAVILSQLRLARRLYENEVPDGDWGTKVQASLIEPVAACLDELNARNWPGCAAGIRAFCKPRLNRPKGLAEAVTDVVAGVQKSAVEAFADLRDLAIVSPDYLTVVGRSASLQTRVLIELVRRFNELYAQRKSHLKGLDFSDLERYALKLLTTEDPFGGKLNPTETALALRQRFKCIFVDEYQDINPVQQAILDALSSGHNVFVVGDVKQSIYAWRGAEPAIFLDRLRPAAAHPQDPAQGFRVDLNYNFRSVKGVLDFVNKVFGRIMTREIAHIDYDEASMLRPAPDAGKTEDRGQKTADNKAPTPIVELHILDERGSSRGVQEEHDTEQDASGGIVKAEGPGNGSAASGESHRQAALDDATRRDLSLVNARQRQAGLIARRIREMVGADSGRAEFQVQDRPSGRSRDVQYRDIVILMRSLAQKANDYVEILRLAGIPVNCDATAGYFEATEVRDMVSLLKVLDNPQRDIDLATVLRGAFFQVTDSDLARIRIYGRPKLKGADFHACVILYAEEGPDDRLRDRLCEVFGQLAQWRSLARRGHLASLIWRIYRHSGFLAFVSALPNGQARKANLLKLHDRAVQFEGFASNAGIASLTRFVDFLERLQDAGQDWAPAQPGSAAGNAVRILSVHKSKGLEFPVVFLAELETQFNTRDIHADLIADTADAVGLQVIDSRSNTKLRSLAHEVIGEKRRGTMLAEEMRILYVATTRARERLILTASQKRTDCGRILAKGLLLGGDTVPAWLLKPCKNALEWVLYGLADQRVLHQAFGTGLTDPVREQGLFDFHLHDERALQELSRLVLAQRSSKAKSIFFTKGKAAPGTDGQRRLAQVRDLLSGTYPFAHAVNLAAKSSVTKLTHQDDMFARRDYSEALDRQPAALVAHGLEPFGARLGQLIGTATHLVISSLDLQRPITLGAIEQTRERLVRDGAIPASIAESIDVEAILAFFAGELGTRVCDPRHTVWREWPFTFGLPAREAVRSGSVRACPETPAGVPPDEDEIVVVQGLIDVLVRTPAGMLILDFKTDHVFGDQIAKRVETYRGQVELYARAAAAIRRGEVREKWLYFLTPRQAVQV